MTLHFCWQGGSWFFQLFFFSVFLRVVGWTSNQKAVKMWHGWSFVSCANVVAGGATRNMVFDLFRLQLCR